MAKDRTETVWTVSQVGAVIKHSSAKPHIVTLFVGSESREMSREMLDALVSDLHEAREAITPQPELQARCGHGTRGCPGRGDKHACDFTAFGGGK